MTSTAAPTASHDKLDVIRKLLAKADGASTPAEAEAYTAKAVELMARHGIDEALLEAGRERKEEIVKRSIDITGPYTREKASLIGWVGDALRCRTVLHSYGKTVYRVTVVGFESDLDRLELLYTSLLLQATSQVIHQRPDWADESTAAFRRTWLVGFASTVSSRVAAAEALAAQQATERQQDAPAGTASTSVELVLVSRAARVEAAHGEFFPKLRKATRRKLTGSGHARGREAGRRADIGQTRVGGQRTAIG